MHPWVPLLVDLILQVTLHLTGQIHVQGLTLPGVTTITSLPLVVTVGVAYEKLVVMKLIMNE